MIQKKSEEIIHNNPFWVYKHDTFQYPDGRTGEYYYGEDRGMVMIVPMLPDGRLVLIKQWRYLLQKNSIEFPGGGIRIDESPDHAAKRELLEETGYGSLSLKQIGTFEQYPGIFKAPAHVYFSFVSEHSQPTLDDTEDISVFIASPQEVKAMVEGGEIIDSATLATWALVCSRLH